MADSLPLVCLRGSVQQSESYRDMPRLDKCFRLNWCTRYLRRIVKKPRYVLPELRFVAKKHLECEKKLDTSNEWLVTVCEESLG